MSSRRNFLAAGAAVLSAPAWISKAFAQEVAGRDLAAEMRELSSSYRRAQQLGRPLLVLVVPVDGGLRYERAHALGEMLNHGHDGLFADLALAEVVCSTMVTLRRLVPQAGEGEPWMVLVEPHAHPAAAQQIDARVPEFPHWTERGADDFERRTQAAIDRRIHALASAVHVALAADSEMLARRARIAELALDAALVRRVHSALRRGAPDLELARSAPAIVRTVGPRSLQPTQWRTMLVAEAQRRLVREEIPGSYWAIADGCGATIENHDDDSLGGMLCGMGHVPERSARFLYWYSSS